MSVTVGDLASKQQVRVDLELTEDQGTEGGSLASRHYPRKYPNDYDEVHTTRNNFFSIIDFIGVDAKCSGGFYYSVDIRSFPHGKG